MGSVKSSSTDYKESNKPNTKFQAQGLENRLSHLEFRKMSFFTFIYIFCSTEKLTFSP